MQHPRNLPNRKAQISRYLAVQRQIEFEFVPRILSSWIWNIFGDNIFGGNCHIKKCRSPPWMHSQIHLACMRKLTHPRSHTRVHVCRYWVSDCTTKSSRSILHIHMQTHASTIAHMCTYMSLLSLRLDSKIILIHITYINANTYIQNRSHMCIYVITECQNGQHNYSDPYVYICKHMHPSSHTCMHIREYRVSNKTTQSSRSILHIYTHSFASKITYMCAYMSLLSLIL